MNLFLVSSKHEFIIVDFFDISYIQIIIFLLIIKDFRNWMFNFERPFPFLFYRERTSFFNYFTTSTSFKIAELVFIDADEISSNETFWKKYHIVLIKEDQFSERKYNFFKLMLSKIFKQFELKEFTF